MDTKYCVRVRVTTMLFIVYCTGVVLQQSIQVVQQKCFCTECKLYGKHSTFFTTLCLPSSPPPLRVQDTVLEMDTAKASHTLTFASGASLDDLQV